jgi:hypothetical protein
LAGHPRTRSHEGGLDPAADGEIGRIAQYFAKINDEHLQITIQGECCSGRRGVDELCAEQLMVE